MFYPLFTASRAIVPTPVVSRRNIIAITLNVNDNDDLQVLRAEFVAELTMVLDDNGIKGVSIQVFDISIDDNK